MANKTVILITGGNNGIGYETAKVLSTSPLNHVIIGSRSPEKGSKAVSTIRDAKPPGTVSSIVLDVTKSSTISSAFQEIEKGFGKVDVLINNAGIISHATDVVDSLRETFETNTIGAAAVTEAFIPLVLKSEKKQIVFVSSGLGSLTLAEDPTNPYYRITANAYRMSKSAMNMYAICTHVKYNAQGVKTWAYCPGYVVTDLTGTGEDGRKERVERGAGSPVVSAEGLRDIVDGKRDGEVGKFVHGKGVYPW